MAMEFEQIWQGRLQSSLERELGTEAARQLIAGLGVSDSTSVSGWTRRTLAELGTLAGTQQCRLVLSGCACRYPAKLLAPIRHAYAASGDLVWAHCMLQAQYLEFLRRDLALEAKVIDIVKANGWGLAGTLNGSTVEATKMPKSGSLLEYLSSTDPDHRRALYCHCPRLRDALALGERMPLDYCYCGAGFYQALWEEILGRSVRVEVVTSVAAGDDDCRIRIDLSPHVT